MVDAIVPAGALTLDLAQELDLLAPFGLGNPEPTLLVASVEAATPATVGEGRHLRFRVRQHGRDGGSAIAFGLGAQLERVQPGGRFDLAFRLKENRWNGTVAPAARRPQALRRPRRRTTSSATGSRRSGARAKPRGRRTRATIFAELGLATGGPPRQLLESETFRALLARPALELPVAA